jgi:3-deoxy-manno-octulosonate cytidylyltransferase (CMP-KDO synthetase)
LNDLGCILKIVGIIPARLKSTRFPNKILLPIHGLPMIEHVRRRALMCSSISEVIVATCDEEIAELVRSNGGKSIMTSDSHQNGTSRVGEAVAGIDCSHVVLLQGDEPLLLPRHIEQLVRSITSNPEISIWNLVAPIETEEETNRHSFVKCAISNTGQILYCYRGSPHVGSFNKQLKFVRKMLGIMAYRKDFLLKLLDMPATPIELAEGIEQLRVLENGYNINYLEVNPALPSINEPIDLQEVLNIFSVNSEQRDLLLDIKANRLK